MLKTLFSDFCKLQKSKKVNKKNKKKETPLISEIKRTLKHHLLARWFDRLEDGEFTVRVERTNHSLAAISIQIRKHRDSLIFRHFALIHHGSGFKF